jgi:hypothetical protein
MPDYYFAYGCETSLTIREEHRMSEHRILEDRVPRKICGQKRDEVTGEWKEANNEDLVTYTSSQI